MPLLLVAAGVLSACGGDESASDPNDPVSRGRQLADDRGCASCHGADGEGVIGPAWVGLAGSDVELEDGTVVTADTDYLRRAVLDPGADVVAGANVAMPENDLTEAEVDDVVAYIESLADEDGGS